jgi:hypothetical protein
VALGDAVDAIRTRGKKIGLPPTIRPCSAGTAQAFQAVAGNEPS